MKLHAKTVTTETYTLSVEEVQAIVLKHLALEDMNTKEIRFLNQYGTCLEVERVRIVATFNDAESNEET